MCSVYKMKMGEIGLGMSMSIFNFLFFFYSRISLVVKREGFVTQQDLKHNFAVGFLYTNKKRFLNACPSY